MADNMDVDAPTTVAKADKKRFEVKKVSGLFVDVNLMANDRAKLVVECRRTVGLGWV